MIAVIFAAPEKIKGLDQVWILGDNFMATSYRKHFLLREDNADGFLKKSFEVQNYCNSRFNSAMKNMLIQIQNTVAGAINKNVALPRYFLIILDADLIEYLDYKKAGLAVMLGDWITWIQKEIAELIAAHKSQLPCKSAREEQPCIYWVAAPAHQSFSETVSECRKKWNFCLESSFKGKTDVCVIKFKNNWDVSDQSLVQHDRLTDKGLSMYWDAVEAAFEFNAHRHEYFLVKKLVTKRANGSDGKKLTSSEDKNKNKHQPQCRQNCSPGEMRRFFNRHRDNYHWHQRDAREDLQRSRSRFMLPRVR